MFQPEEDTSAFEICLPHQWEPRSYQLPAWTYLENGGKRCVLIWHRRAGKDSLSLNWTVTAAMERVGLYWHLLPTYSQGRKIIWNGMTKEGRKFLDYFPPEIVKNTNKTDMQIDLINGSIYQVVGTDYVDRLVGSNPIGVIFSEYSLQDPRAWELIRPILAENGGWAIFPYTPRGKNHGHERFRRAKKNDKWFAQLLTVEDTGVISKDAIEEERKDGMSDEMIQQEFYCSFEAGVIGAYFSQQIIDARREGRISRVPHYPDLPVFTWWDIGMDDCTTIIFTQNVNRELHIIDYYEQSGEGMPHYVKILKDKPYIYARHSGPHDLKVRELGTGKSREATARQLGIKFDIQRKPKYKNDTIEMARNIFPRCWIDEIKCERLIACLENYRKEYDEKRKVFLEHPERDWSCHGSDAFQNLAQGHIFEKKKGSSGTGGYRRGRTAADTVAGY